MTRDRADEAVAMLVYDVAAKLHGLPAHYTEQDEPEPPRCACGGWVDDHYPGCEASNAS